MGHLEEFSRWPAKRFIETGFGEGRTLLAASQVYPECITIELYEARYWNAVEMFKDQPNVRIFHGNSGDILKRIVNPDISTMFWLDAHFVEADTVKVEGYGLCPILDELAFIKGLEWKEKPIILIDDWSTFRQHDLFKWPRLDELDAVMGIKHQRFQDLPGGDVFGYYDWPWDEWKHKNDIPRRIRVDLMTPAELAIRAAVLAVEEAGCDPLLTDAVVLLQQAKEKVADFVDRVLV